MCGAGAAGWSGVRSLILFRGFFLLRTVVVAFAMLLVGIRAEADENAMSAPARPNIVFIVADDMGYADASCYGRRDFRTPAIDQLAERGVRLTQAYANSPVCTAARVALITGRYPARLRIGLEEPLAAKNREVGLPPEHPTLPSLLKRAGYRTMLVGKWHLGFPPKFGPRQSGYERFFGFRGGAVDYFFHGFGEEHDLWEDDTRVQRTGYLTHLLGERAVAAIAEYAKGAEPFFLSLHFSAPHWPWEGPKDEAESARLQAAGGGLLHFDGGSQQSYREMMETMDGEIARVVDALEANGIAENTIVIFTSDHGGERYSDMGPFRGMKTELLEGGLRVPAIVCWPARIQTGQVSEQVSAGVDWLPTLLAAAGVEAAPDYPSDGMNLLPQLAEGAANVDRALFWRFKAHAQRAARIGDFKFMKILENTFLFDVGRDPMERANLKARRPEVYQRLETAWFEWNDAMLPEIAESHLHAFDATQLAERYGVKKPTRVPEPVVRPTRR